MATAVATEALPLARPSGRRLLLLGAGAAAMLGSLVLLVPAVGDLSQAVGRLGDAQAGWLLAALGLELVSFLGYIVLFRAVCVDGGSSRIDLKVSAQITLAGTAATRVFASGGAGGVALTAWALRRAGLDRAAVAARMVAFLVLLYAVYMLALVVGGLGLALGLLPGNAPLAMTIAPAALGAGVIAAALAAQRIGPGDGRVCTALAPVGQGVRDARALLARREPGLLGALAWWAGDVAVLLACLHAFGASPPVAIVVVSYFVGMLANLLPLPGGVGGVDGGMVGALVLFGVDPATAVVGVLAYRGFAFWLPIVPGVLAFVSLRRTVSRWGREDVFGVPAERVACPAGPREHPRARRATRACAVTHQRATLG
ncbi:MAG: lysylphosphatidylglycerol synthase transmembrane domain-containing protein [Solirubrobacteraceae bacterium]